MLRSPIPLGPSDALAAVAEVVHRFLLQHGTTAQSWLTNFEDGLPSPQEEWALDAQQVVQYAAKAGNLSWPPRLPSIEKDFENLICALQILDRWHRPIAPIDRMPVPRLPDHDDLFSRTNPSRPYFGKANGGIIIPRRTPISISRPSGTMPFRPVPLLFELLDYTAFLPDSIGAMDNSNVVNRQLNVEYLLHQSTLPAPDCLIDDGLASSFRVGIAPMIEQESDCHWEISPCQTKYSVEACYPPNRIADVVQAALAQEVNLLLLPEASVHTKHLATLQTAIRDNVRAHQANTDRLPPLHYVIAGLAGPAASGAGHENFVVVIDMFGKEVFRQHKMLRWDIRPDQQKRFGMYEKFCLDSTSASYLVEQIPDPQRIVVADLSDIGRLFNLICADMSFDLPGDWFLNLGIDWLNAPIFDQFIGPLQPTPPDTPTWICDRSLRAATAGNRVMVSNSLALTCRLNAENAARNLPYPIVDPCCIGLFLDRVDGRTEFKRLEVKLSAQSPILAVGSWTDKWTSI